MRQIIVTWHHDRPGPVNGDRYVQIHRSDGVKASVTPDDGTSLTLKTDGNDFGFRAAEHKMFGRRIGIGDRTSVHGLAEDGTDRARAMERLESAVLTALEAGRGNSSPARADTITLNARTLDGSSQSSQDAWAHWKVGTEPAEVRAAVEAAAAVGDGLDGIKASMLLDTRKGVATLE